MMKPIKLIESYLISGQFILEDNRTRERKVETVTKEVDGGTNDIPPIDYFFKDVVTAFGKLGFSVIEVCYIKEIKK